MKELMKTGQAGGNSLVQGAFQENTVTHNHAAVEKTVRDQVNNVPVP